MTVKPSSRQNQADVCETEQLAQRIAERSKVRLFGLTLAEFHSLIDKRFKPLRTARGEIEISWGRVETQLSIAPYLGVRGTALDRRVRKIIEEPEMQEIIKKDERGVYYANPFELFAHAVRRRNQDSINRAERARQQAAKRKRPV